MPQLTSPIDFNPESCYLIPFYYLGRSGAWPAHVVAGQDGRLEHLVDVPVQQLLHDLGQLLRVVLVVVMSKTEGETF